MATGAQVVQVTTKGGCHLNANMVEKAWHDLVTQDKTAGLLFVENVGNLVCPASFDLGETMKGVVLSVTEGEDKPIKYPKAFRLARFCVINKTDLLPHLDFDLDQCRHYIRQVNPSIDIFEVSAKTSAGLDSLQDYFTALVP